MSKNKLEFESYYGNESLRKILEEHILDTMKNESFHEPSPYIEFHEPSPVSEGDLENHEPSPVGEVL